MKSRKSSQIKYWLLWQVAVPLGFLGLFCPVHAVVLQDQFWFERAFGDGDLLFFSALLLMGVAVQVKIYDLDRGRLGEALSFEREVARAGAFFAIFVYGAVRYHLVLTGAEIPMGLRWNYAILGCSSVFFSVGFGLYSLAKAEDAHILRQEEQRG